VGPKREIVGINYAQRNARCINITFTNGFTHFSSAESIEGGGGEGSLEVDTAKDELSIHWEIKQVGF